MISRKTLQELFDNLPAVLVLRLGVDADEAISMADNCLIEVEHDTVFQVAGNERIIWVYVSKPGRNELSNYRLAFADSTTPSHVKWVEKLSPRRLGGNYEWEKVAA